MPGCRAPRPLVFPAFPLVLLLVGCGPDASNGPAESSLGQEAREGGDVGASEAVFPDSPLTFAEIAEDTATFMEILRVEDRRGSQPGDLERLARATGSPHPGIRRAAVRALGRLEVADAADALRPLLEDPDPRVGAEAANALAQISRSLSAGELRDVRRALGEVARDETDGIRWGALARSLGRLPVDSRRDVEAMEERLLSLLPDPPARDEALLLGFARGVLSLYRQGAKVEGWRPNRALSHRMSELGQQEYSRPIRIASAHALWVSRAVGAEHVQSWLEDPDPEVRRVGAAALPLIEAVGSAPSDPGTGDPQGDPRGTRRTDELLQGALTDVSERVRVEAVRSWAALAPGAEDCTPLAARVDDPSDHVALVSLAALVERCPDLSGIDDLLYEMAADLPDPREGNASTRGEGRGGAAGGGPAGGLRWHRSAGALSALSRRAPDRAGDLLARHARHPDPFVRTHAARSAGVAGARELLEALARDDAPNVREAALRGLAASPGPVPLSLLNAQLVLDDAMLLRATAQLLEGRMGEGGAEEDDLVEGLLGALGRLTDSEALTTRDARVLLLRRIGESERPGLAERIRSYLRDFDPVVAGLTAEILRERGESTVVANPTDPAQPALPGLAELRAMDRNPVTVEMANGERFAIQLLPFEAPTNAARFMRMAQAGTFDDLTFHRVVPNFVIQGGSPGANEYAGHGAYTRDEIGLTGHWRGTVGVSTRGRDTGDGQIFVNLVTNLRLDHDYTVFGRVTSGLDVVDRIQEGGRMGRIMPDSALHP